jgi:DNA mismatch endonuclease Vsr
MLQRVIGGVAMASIGIDSSIKVKLRAIGAQGYKTYGAIDGARPNIYFPDAKLAIFIQGCQWSGCKDHFVTPDTDSQYWVRKVLEIKDKDRETDGELIAKGWVVERIWECEINNFDDVAFSGYVTYLWERAKSRTKSDL